MAWETVTLNSGSGGSSVAVDSVGGAVFQGVKLAAGPDGTALFGATPYSFISAAGSNQDSTVVQAAATTLYSIIVTNTNTAARYLKLYNKATGPTSSDTPVGRYAIPGSGGIAINLTHNLLFSTGLAFRLTTGATDADTNAVAANEILVNLGYA